ncbi:lactate permease [Phycomyces nitens]|nr:lactate permease [Phycomyces nitens]
MVNIPTIPASAYATSAFVQPLTPIGDSLIASFFVGLIPLLLVFILLGVCRIPAHIASLAGLVTCIFIAIFGWRMPAHQAFSAIGNGIVFANWPIMWIVISSMFLYNTSVRSGIFDMFRRWILVYTPPDKRVILVIVGYCFGALLEGVAGFGVPGAICSPLMVSLGFDPMDALVYTLIFDTTPVAFGALGTPITTLATITGLPAMQLSAMVGRQLPFLSLFLPLYVLGLYAGLQAGIIECWPMALVAGLSFSGTQAVFSNLVGPELPDLIAGLVSLGCLVGFVQVWKPPYRSEYYAIIAMPTTDPEENDKDTENSNQCKKYMPTLPDPNLEKGFNPPDSEALSRTQMFLAWSPWTIIVVVVIIWTFSNASKVGQVDVKWPGLHQKVYLTLYSKNYDAVWVFQPLGTGTAIFLSAIIFCGVALGNGSDPIIFCEAFKDTFIQLYRPIITVSFIMGFAYLYNYSGIVYTIGLTLSSVGPAFPFLSAWLGWVACFLSGSDTSANSLFGNLQVVTAREIGLSAVLMAATNSSGAIASKMVSPQNMSTIASTINLQGKEGLALRRTIFHSILIVCIVGAIACIQQYGIPSMIPS